MPSGSAASPMTMPAAPASSRPARTAKYRVGTPTVWPMTATTWSVCRSFIEAEEAQMAASRTVTMTRPMNTVLLETGCDWWCRGRLRRGSAELLADLRQDLGAEQLDGAQ